MSQEISFFSLTGPVEKQGKDLILSIPLSAGGDNFIQITKGIASIADDCLNICPTAYTSEGD